MNEKHHIYTGEYDPKNKKNIFPSDTFSVGCFLAGQKARGVGLKRIGAVKVRVRGMVSNPQPVYDKAKEICLALDDGTYAGPKYVTVK